MVLIKLVALQKNSNLELHYCRLKVLGRIIRRWKKRERYQEFKKKCGWQFVDRLAELINFPDLRKHVEVMEVATRSH
jgi:hypothetical protein